MSDLDFKYEYETNRTGSTFTHSECDQGCGRLSGFRQMLEWHSSITYFDNESIEQKSKLAAQNWARRIKLGSRPANEIILGDCQIMTNWEEFF